MRTLIDPTPHPGLLLVLLTGTYSEPEDFIREGFAQAVRDRGIPAGIVMVGTPASRVADGSIVEGLRETVIAPARKLGQDRIWLAGISLGGLAALAYAARREQDLEGLVLLSPYPGTRQVLLEIEAAGGLARWRSGVSPADDVEREAWAWLARRGAHPRVHLYYGARDRFAEGQRRMAQALPTGAAEVVEGDHDWPSWRRQWSRFLDDHGASLGAAPPLANTARTGFEAAQ
jgi:pimeloyl-ACP methyl ester carboxylesterase